MKILKNIHCLGVATFAGLEARRGHAAPSRAALNPCGPTGTPLRNSPLLRELAAGVFICLLVAVPAMAQNVLPWFDNFDPGPHATYVPWPGSPSDLLASDTAHALSGSASLRAFASDPGNWTSSYQMSSDTANGVRGYIAADVYVWDDNSVANTASTPVNAMLAYVGANNSTTPGFGTDYAELGIISGNTANLDNWVVRVRSYDQANGTTWFDTGVSRASLAQTWAHLQIVADALPSDGGDGLFHFFINGNEVVSDTVNLSRNSAVGEEWVRMGSNSKTYENFWYDNLSIVPEPSGLVLLGLGCVGLVATMARRGRARNE
jgi:hypothetical protein